MIDAKTEHLELIRKAVMARIPGCEIWVFGSRISGKAKPWSDLDIALISRGPIDLATMAAIRDDLDESDLPYRVDVLNWHNISKEFRAIIEDKHIIL